VTRAILSGPRARDMKAWAGASPTNGGPGNRANQFARGLKGRNRIPAAFNLHVPPFQGEEICLGTFAWGCARRASPQAVTWRAFSPRRPIVSELDALQAEVDALKRLQSETAAELDALLPAILDRAIKGEL
jgi:hypothetical protein